MNRRNRENRLLEMKFGWGIIELLFAARQQKQENLAELLKLLDSDGDLTFVSFLDDNNRKNTAVSDVSRLSRFSSFLSEVRSFELSLQKMENAEFQEVYKVSVEKERLDTLKFKEAHGREKDEEDFFNEPEAAVRIDEWLSKPSWTAEEAVAISLGKDPLKVNIATLSPMNRITGSPFRKTFLERLDAVRRAIAGKQLKENFRPSQFNIWAKKHSSFFENGAKARYEGSYNSIHGNVLHTFYRILLAVAIDKYGYDIKQPSRTNLLASASAISVIINKKGLRKSVSHKTVENHLMAAHRWAKDENALTTQPAPAARREKSETVS